MANPVYSQPFILYSTDTPNLSFAVPAGYTAIIRQLSAAQPAVAFSLALIMQLSEDAPYIFLVFEEATGLYNTLLLEGRWVVPEGGIITIDPTALGDSLTVYVGGYLIANSYSR